MKPVVLSDKGVKCIVLSEGLKLHAYEDTGGVWTIGIGTTRYPDGTRVRKGDTCTEYQAYQWLRHDVRGACKDVDDLTRDDLTQAQFDALVSLVYNIGRGQYSTSTVRRLVNLNPADKKIRDAFLMWNKDNGKPVNGLTNRRVREADLYFSDHP